MQGWTIVFDLDGTLIDTAPDLAEATNHVLSTLGLERINEMEIRPFVGHGALAMIDGAVKAHGRKLPERELHDLFEVFLTYYSAHIADRSVPYPHIVAALDGLKAEGATLAVCTNKMEAQARAVLEALKLDGYFSALTGRDSLGAYKPDPRHLTGTIALAGGQPGKSIMIGDSETDIRTAKAAQVPVVAVSFGYSIDPVLSFGPDVIINDYRELRGAIGKLAGMPVSS
ncbi:MULTISPECIES: HAD family hydrolase [unclassified Hyphomicrobium]|uniref:HAD family hydrolase n=1 Tax=unclassified Hyphomicrobium TaxID=2619925 RepID=UPI000213ED66|nr:MULTISPECIES: HAD family hydrolase [unclassified Hyphomicrobium]CCB65443.1 putative haloacid dehalogenase family hydrolase [Hyphomicrobium sp. MC1]